MNKDDSAAHDVVITKTWDVVGDKFSKVHRTERVDTMLKFAIEETRRATIAECTNRPFSQRPIFTPEDLNYARREMAQEIFKEFEAVLEEQIYVFGIDVERLKEKFLGQSAEVEKPDAMPDYETASRSGTDGPYDDPTVAVGKSSVDTRKGCGQFHSTTFYRCGSIDAEGAVRICYDCQKGREGRA